MHCPSCGNDVVPGSGRCDRCGVALGGPDTATFVAGDIPTAIADPKATTGGEGSAAQYVAPLVPATAYATLQQLLAAGKK